MLPLKPVAEIHHCLLLASGGLWTIFSVLWLMDATLQSSIFTWWFCCISLHSLSSVHVCVRSYGADLHLCNYKCTEKIRDYMVKSEFISLTFKSDITEVKKGTRGDHACSGRVTQTHITICKIDS